MSVDDMPEIGIFFISLTISAMTAIGFAVLVLSALSSALALIYGAYWVASQIEMCIRRKLIWRIPESCWSGKP